MRTYDYAATLVRLIDGDTVILAVHETYDFGFHLILTPHATLRFRLARINCPELPTPAGIAAKAYAGDWLAAHPELRAATSKTDNYGRWLAEIRDASTGANLNDALLDSGHAIKYS